MKPYIYAGLVIAVMAFVYWWSSNQYDAGYTAAKAKYETDLRKAQSEHARQTKQKQDEIDSITKKWLEEQGKERIVYQTIEKKVNKYVKDSTACNFSRGAVWLHNKAWHSSSSGGMQENTGLSEEEKQETSTVTKSQVIKKDIEYAEWCTSLENNYDTLLKAIDALGY